MPLLSTTVSTSTYVQLFPTPPVSVLCAGYSLLQLQSSVCCRFASTESLLESKAVSLMTDDFLPTNSDFTDFQKRLIFTRKPRNSLPMAEDDLWVLICESDFGEEEALPAVFSMGIWDLLAVLEHCLSPASPCPLLLLIGTTVNLHMV